jgi:hypothetical protein
MRDALNRDLEAARYAADRAFRQYDAADPANRLVACELEARWNGALTHVAEVETKIAAHDAAMPAAAVDPLTLGLLASNLRTVWFAPTTDARLKKRIVRTIIHEMVADIDDAAAEIVLVVHWIGGVHSEMRLPKRRRGQRNSIRRCDHRRALIADDDLIAGILNRNDQKTGNGNRWTCERATSMRLAIASLCSSLPRTAQSHGCSTGATPRSFCRLRPRRYGLPRQPERSRQSIHSLTEHGSLPAPRSRRQPLDRSPNGHERTRDTSRDRIPTNKACSLQPYRQMGVVVPDCRSRDSGRSMCSHHRRCRGPSDKLPRI